MRASLAVPVDHSRRSGSPGRSEIGFQFFFAANLVDGLWGDEQGRVGRRLIRRMDDLAVGPPHVRLHDGVLGGGLGVHPIAYVQTPAPWPAGDGLTAGFGLNGSPDIRGACAVAGGVSTAPP